jgi:hypothetical protein
VFRRDDDRDPSELLPYIPRPPARNEQDTPSAPGLNKKRRFVPNLEIGPGLVPAGLF